MKGLNWWLRSPGNNNNNAANVNDDGNVNNNGNEVDNKNGVRPALPYPPEAQLKVWLAMLPVGHKQSEDK